MMNVEIGNFCNALCCAAWRQIPAIFWHKSQNPLHQFPHRKSVTSWRGQKSVVSAVSCRFPNSITTTCCQVVADLLALSLTSPQQVQVRSKLATSPYTGKLRGNVCNAFWALYSRRGINGVNSASVADVTITTVSVIFCRGDLRAGVSESRTKK